VPAYARREVRVSRRTRLASLLAFAAAAAPAAAAGTAAAVALPERFLQGFVRRLSGEVIPYAWSYPGKARTMLSRATDGRMAVEWEGEPAAPGDTGEAVSYLWHAGLNSGRSGGHRFTLTVNDNPPLEFTTSLTSDDREWTVRGAAGETLSFVTVRVTAFDERFGFMALTAPRAYFGAGAPRFRVVGEAAGSIDYYLGPEERIEAWTRVTPEEAVHADGGRALRVEFSHLGAAAPAEVRAGGATLWSGTVALGYRRVAATVHAAAGARVPVSVVVGGRETFAGTLALAPVAARELRLLPHSHVDVGYSDPQPEVERKQWQNLRDAVALARETAAFPREARFRWNVEGLWYVESYLAQAGPQERDAFLSAVRSGSIGLQANATGVLTGLCSPEELRRLTDGARRLRAAYGVPPIRSAMQSDIPGVSWTAVAALAQGGVRYVSSGPNYFTGLPGGGDRIGSTLEALGDRPFWWVSPSGEERVLFWMAGRGYSSFHGLTAGSVPDLVELALLDLARELAQRGYPFDLAQVRYTIGGDNGPVDRDLPAFVRDWNERYRTPRLALDTAESLFADMERRHGDALPALAGDMTPYWEDGAVSTAAEEASARASARRIVQAQALWALRDAARFPAALAGDAWRAVIMWREHTWGAADSVREPDRPDVVAQWVFKRGFARDADRLSRQLLDGAAPPAGAAVEVVNTLSWERSGVVTLPPWVAAGRRAASAGGRPLPAQRLADGSLAVWVDGVPALGALRLELGHGAPASPAHPVTATPAGLAGDRMRVTLDPRGGAVSGLYWSGAGEHNLVAPGPGLLGYLYVPGLDPTAARGNGPAHIAVVDPGPLVATVRVESEAPGTRGLVRTVRLVAGADAVELAAHLDKAPVRAKESAHLAFPFALADAVVRVDLGEAVLEPGRNQLPGSCLDFAGAHSAADVSEAGVGVSVATLDSPLVEIGALTDERLHGGTARPWRSAVAPGSALYAYVLNNYWHTNYKADQEGAIEAHFAVRPHGPYDAAALRHFSAEQEQPLLAFPVDPAAPPLRAPFSVSPASVVIASLRPVDGGRALLLRLYNASSEPAAATVTPAVAGARLHLSDETGAAGDPVTNPLAMPGFATRTVRLSLR
jgi:hypothetical protein